MKDTITIQSDCEKTIRNQVQFSWWSVLFVLVFVWVCISAIVGMFAGILYLIF